MEFYDEKRGMCLKAYQMRDQGAKLKDIASFFQVSETTGRKMALKGGLIVKGHSIWDFYPRPVNSNIARWLKVLGYEFEKKESSAVFAKALLDGKYYDLLKGSGIGEKTISEAVCFFKKKGMIPENFQLPRKDGTTCVKCPHCGKYHSVDSGKTYLMKTGKDGVTKNKNHWHKGQVSSLGINAVTRIIGEYREHLTDQDIGLVKSAINDAKNGGKPIFMAGRKTVNELYQFFEINY